MAVTSDGTPYCEPGDAISAWPVVSQELAAVIDSLRTMIPAGAIFPYAGKLAPEGYLMCDGKAYNRGDFFDLYNRMAEWVGQWGGFPNGDSSLFFVPDFRGRAPMGLSIGLPFPVCDIALGQRQGDSRVAFHTHPVGNSEGAAPGLDRASAGNTVSNISGGPYLYDGGWVPQNAPQGTPDIPPVTGVNFIVWTGTTTTGKNPVPGVELPAVTTRMMIEARLEEAGIGEEEIEMLREQLAALKEDTNG